MSTTAGPTLTDHDLAALRRAAALVRVLGDTRLDVFDAGQLHVRVERPSTGLTASSGAATGGGGPDVAVVRIGPDGFHRAVVRAWQDHRAGRPVALAGGRGPLDVRWGVHPPGAGLGFGAVRTTCAGRFVWAFASLLGLGELVDVLGGMAPAPHPAGAAAADELAARLAPDDALGATVVHVDAEITDVAMVRAVDEVMRGLVAAVGAAEVLATLGDGVGHGHHEGGAARA
jgi:hypothetical protein